MKPFALLLAVSATFLLSGAAMAGEPTAPPALAPSPGYSHWEAAAETGVMFGINNPNDYVTAPQIFSIRWQYQPAEEFFHTGLMLRNQFTFGLVAVPFATGPEHYYFGLAVGRRFNFSKPGSRFGVYLEGRFAVGTIDSSGPPHGQGEDMSFNALVNAGVTYEISKRTYVGLGLLYEHFSNGGFSEPEEPNVGLNTVGPQLSLQLMF